MITTHTSCKYGVMRVGSVSGDYQIVAVHALTPTFPGDPNYALVSHQKQAHDEAHVWGPPRWVSTGLIVALCQTSETAARYRRWLMEQDRETEEANIR